MVRNAVCAASLLLAASLDAHAGEVAKSVEIAAPPEKVWEVIGGFCGIGDWHPAIESCTPSSKDGQVLRTLLLKDGGTIVEAELARSDAKMSYSYSILQSPLPVANYTSTIAVTPGGKGTRVVWFGVFEPKDVPDAKAQEVVTGIYEAGLAGIAKMAGKPAE